MSDRTDDLRERARQAADTWERLDYPDTFRLLRELESSLAAMRERAERAELEVAELNERVDLFVGCTVANEDRTQAVAEWAARQLKGWTPEMVLAAVDRENGGDA